MTDDGKAVSAMDADFRDYDNDGLPDIAFREIAGETFPLFCNLGNGQFRDATIISRMGPLSVRLAGGRSPSPTSTTMDGKTGIGTSSRALFS